MPISFADVPLLLPDPQGELSQWIEKYLSLRDLRLWGARPLVREDLSAEPRTVDRYRVPMPQVNWPAPPAMRLNTLWWPTGATRWAAGLFLADKERLDAIVGAVGDDGGGTLVLDEGPERRSIDPWMHLLSPRRITACGDSPLYLLPLVDVRYFWQLRHVRLQGQVTNDTTWTQLLGLLEAALEITVSAGAIPTEYGRPDPIEWSRAGNPAALLDAFAWSVGLRYVYSWTQQHFLWTAYDSIQANEANYGGWPPEAAGKLGLSRFGGEALEEGPYAIVAGGIGDSLASGSGSAAQQYERVAPAGVRVYYRNLCAANADTYPIDVSAEEAGYTLPTIPATTKVFRDTGWAERGNAIPPPEEPLNKAELTSLARRVAEDYYRHLAQPIDLCAAGIKVWIPSGMDDGVLWQFGAQPAGGGYAAQTRVWSLPPEVGVSTLWHQAGDVIGQRARFIQFRATEQFEVTDEWVKATLYQWWDGENPDPENEGLTVRNHRTSVGWLFEGHEGDYFTCTWNDVDCRYEMIQGECPP